MKLFFYLFLIFHFSLLNAASTINNSKDSCKSSFQLTDEKFPFAKHIFLIKARSLFPGPYPEIPSIERSGAQFLLGQALMKMGKLEDKIKSETKILDLKLMEHLEVGTYAFIVLPKEEKIRIAPLYPHSHSKMSYGAAVVSAGEIIIQKNQFQENYIKEVNNQSGSYRPPKDSLFVALKHLVENNLYNQDLKIKYIIGIKENGEIDFQNANL